MENAEKLKNARNLLLKLHKSLIDQERALYEGIHGPVSATQFLGVLLDDADFGWLRKFSMLIVDIDEMFDLKDGISSEMVAANLAKMVDLVEMSDGDEYFKAKYMHGLLQSVEAAGYQKDLKAVLA